MTRIALYLSDDLVKGQEWDYWTGGGVPPAGGGYQQTDSGAWRRPKGSGGGKQAAPPEAEKTSSEAKAQEEKANEHSDNDPLKGDGAPDDAVGGDRGGPEDPTQPSQSDTDDERDMAGAGGTGPEEEGEPQQSEDYSETGGFGPPQEPKEQPEVDQDPSEEDVAGAEDVADEDVQDMGQGLPETDTSDVSKQPRNYMPDEYDIKDKQDVQQQATDKFQEQSAAQDKARASAEAEVAKHAEDLEDHAAKTEDLEARLRDHDQKMQTLKGDQTQEVADKKSVAGAEKKRLNEYTTKRKGELKKLEDRGKVLDKQRDTAIKKVNQEAVNDFQDETTRLKNEAAETAQSIREKISAASGKEGTQNALKRELQEHMNTHKQDMQDRTVELRTLRQKGSKGAATHPSVKAVDRKISAQKEKVKKHKADTDTKTKKYQKSTDESVRNVEKLKKDHATAREKLNAEKGRTKLEIKDHKGSKPEMSDSAKEHQKGQAAEAKKKQMDESVKAPETAADKATHASHKQEAQTAVDDIMSHIKDNESLTPEARKELTEIHDVLQQHAAMGGMPSRNDKASMRALKKRAKDIGADKHHNERIGQKMKERDKQAKVEEKQQKQTIKDKKTAQKQKETEAAAKDRDPQSAHDHLAVKQQKDQIQDRMIDVQHAIKNSKDKTEREHLQQVHSDLQEMHDSDMVHGKDSQAKLKEHMNATKHTKGGVAKEDREAHKDRVASRSARAKFTKKIRSALSGGMKAGEQAGKGDVSGAVNYGVSGAVRGGHYLLSASARRRGK